MKWLKEKHAAVQYASCMQPCNVGFPTLRTHPWHWRAMQTHYRTHTQA